MRHPFGSEMHPLSPHCRQIRTHVHANCLLVTFEVALDEVTLLKGVFDWIAMLAA
jgi:hypothetical protein